MAISCQSDGDTQKAPRKQCEGQAFCALQAAVSTLKGFTTPAAAAVWCSAVLPGLPHRRGTAAPPYARAFGVMPSDSEDDGLLQDLGGILGRSR